MPPTAAVTRSTTILGHNRHHHNNTKAEEEHKLVHQRVLQEESPKKEASNLNEQQFTKLDELLTQTQLYPEFLLEKMDDITKEDDAKDLQINETSEDQSSPVEDPPKHEAEEAEISIETHSSGAGYKEPYAPRQNYHNQRGGRNGGRRGGYGIGRGGRSGGRGGPYQNGGRNLYNDQPGNYYHGGRGRGGGRGGDNYYNNGYNHHAPPGVEVADS